MEQKTLSAKQINILTKNGIKEPWNLPYQDAADKIGEILANYDPKPPVVKPGVPVETKPKNGTTYRTPEQMIMCEMTGHAKDVFCAILEFHKGANGLAFNVVMVEAISLVKQAKEAFE